LQSPVTSRGLQPRLRGFPRQRCRPVVYGGYRARAPWWIGCAPSAPVLPALKIGPTVRSA